MNEENLPERLAQAEKRISDHPSRPAILDWEGIGRSITMVFLPNWREVVGLLEQASSDETLALELVQNMHEPVVREQFHALVTQRLHNYLASAKSLVDHVRRASRWLDQARTEAYEDRKRVLLEQPEVQFVFDLRNFTLHRSLPWLGHTLTMKNLNTPDAKMTSEVLLSVSELEAWSDWRPVSRLYLEQQGESIALRPLIVNHGQGIAELNIWAANELGQQLAPAIDETNELILLRNAVLVGGDMATARLVSEGGMRALHERDSAKTED